MMPIAIPPSVMALAGASPVVSMIIFFCASTLPYILSVAGFLYILSRPLRTHDPFASIENTAHRALDFILLAIASFGTYFFSVVLKKYFMVARPDFVRGGLEMFLTKDDYGFPSGHAAFFGALATMLFFMNRKAGIVAGIGAIVIGISRILAGVHSALDITGGYLLGISVAVLVAYLAERIDGHNDLKK